jgi:hypothetical protein
VHFLCSRRHSHCMVMQFPCARVTFIFACRSPVPTLNTVRRLAISIPADMVCTKPQDMRKTSRSARNNIPQAPCVVQVRQGTICMVYPVMDDHIVWTQFPEPSRPRQLHYLQLLTGNRE